MDSAWAQRQRRRLVVYFSILGVVLLLVYLGIKLYSPPSCFDGKQNQGEVGVDCGGPCSLLCTSQVQPLKTVWATAFQVSQGWYSAVAYVENPNTFAYARNVPYQFRLFDRQGVEIAQKRGLTYVANHRITPVYVGRIDTGVQDVHQVTFEWLQNPEWYRADQSPVVLLEQQTLSRARLGQELSVEVYNSELAPVRDARFVAVLYNAQDNPIAVSETYVETLLPRAKKTIVFTWPGVFSETPTRIEIVPRIPLQQ